MCVCVFMHVCGTYIYNNLTVYVCVFFVCLYACAWNSLSVDVSTSSSLKVRQDSWQRQLEAIPPLKTLMANCILAAALTVYCGPLDTSARYTVFDSLLAMTRHCGVISGNEDQKSLLSLSSYAAFMLGEVYIIICDSLDQMFSHYS